MRINFSILLLLCSLTMFSQHLKQQPLQATDSLKQKQWVDSIYNQLNVKQRIGQLFMVQAFSNKGVKHKTKILQLVRDYGIGGIIFSKGGPVRQARFYNELQAVSEVPLLVGMDAEWGLAMRLDSTYAFPWNMTLGAIDDLKLIEKTGKHIGEHCKRLGVHFNFAPVVDINTNPKNPIIGNRSFGEDKENVTQKALAFMRGMQNAGVLANAKHFPGHGDTEQDSHLTLPTVNFSEKRIDSIELFPYKALFKEGLSSVMVAHLKVPHLEPSGRPSSLSKTIVTGILKKKLNFNGLIFTDALTMKGVADYDDAGAVDLAAFKAGNDVLLMPEDVEKGISKIEKAFSEGVITEQRLEHSVKKILRAKYKAGLSNYEPVGLYNLTADLNRLEDDVLYEELMEKAITVVKNQNNLLPLRQLDTRKIAYVSLGDDSGYDFLECLKEYTVVHEIKANKLDELIKKLQNYNTVVVGFHKSNSNPWAPYEFSQKDMTWLYEIARTNTVILDVFARPYALNDLKAIKNINAIVMSYQNSEIAQKLSAQLIFGAIAAQGKLPVSVGNVFPTHHGMNFNALSNLSYGSPERVGLSSLHLSKIDSIVNYAIAEEMTPGAQVLVARKGKVVYHKTFGYHTYDKKLKVESNDVYDVASLTKIVATLPLIMELEENGIISLDTKLSELLPVYKKSNKRHVTVKQMLSHYARLKPWIPFYLATLDSVTKKPSTTYYQNKRRDGFNVEVSSRLFMRDDYQDSIQERIRETELLPRLRYRYSDLPYYILREFIQTHYGKTLKELVQDHFYSSLGANYTTYNPREKFSLRNIVPTEEDGYFRFSKVHGYVHDMGAAMQGGVGGHAGIFSNANDIAKIMQMYLQKGFYGGKRYFDTETLDKFNTCYFCESDNRRGVGFDKPQLSDEGPTCGCLSMTSFGHSGFTGTYAWADPEEQVVYVFMSNRTYPSAENNKLLKENIRTEIQRVIYEAIMD